MSESGDHIQVNQQVDNNEGEIVGVKYEQHINLQLEEPERILYELFAEVLQSWLPGIRKSTSDNRGLLAKGAKAYRKEVLRRYDQMQIFGQPEPKPLSDIYINVNILEKLAHMRSFSADELHKKLGADVRSLGQIGATKDGLDVVNSIPRLTVLGKPGAGKTTFLKLITIKAIQGELEQNVLPIFVSLKDWSDSGSKLSKYITDQFAICNFPGAKKFIPRLLKKGQCLILFDGYDEVPNPGLRVVKELNDFIERYNQNRYILSCRIAAYHQTFVGFTLVEVADFDENQIQQFINKWFSENPDKGAKCWDKLKDNDPVKELASTPLLLTMLCILFDEELDFPTRKAMLYKRALHALWVRWDSSRGIQRNSLFDSFEIEEREMLLCHLAKTAFENGEYFIEQHIMEARIKEFIKDINEVTEENIKANSHKVLKAIEANHGLLVERSVEVYSFSHLTFQEYFTAKYFVENNDSTQTLEHLFEDNWREIIILTNGQLTSRKISDAFLQTMRTKIRYFAVQKELIDFLSAAYSLIKPDSPLSGPQSRLYALIYATTVARDQAQDRAKDMAHVRSRALELDKALKVDRELDSDLAWGLIRELKLEVDQDLNLEREKDRRTVQTRARELSDALNRDRGQALVQALDLGRALDLAGVLAEKQPETRELAPTLDQDKALELNLDRARDLVSYLNAKILLVECVQTSYSSKKLRKEIMEDLFLEPLTMQPPD